MDNLKLSMDNGKKWLKLVLMDDIGEKRINTYKISLFLCIKYPYPYFYV